MPQIIPIKDLEDTANVSELCHTLNEPIYITKNSYGDMVLMSMDYSKTHGNPLPSPYCLTRTTSAVFAATRRCRFP